MPVPPYREFIDALLRTLAEVPDGLKASDACELVATRFGLSQEQRAELLPSEREPAYRNRIWAANRRMKQVGLCDGSSFGIWRLTEQGKTYVARHPIALNEREVSELIDQAKTTETIDWKDRLTRFRQEPRWQADLEEESG
jgi:restriction system protein